MKLILSFSIGVVLSSITVACHAQQSGSLNAVKAYAKGDDSYLQFHSNNYNDQKKYVVIKLWNEKEPMGEEEKTALEYLKIHLAKKNVEVAEIQWKAESDLKEQLSKYNLNITVSDGKHVKLDGGNYMLSTTSLKSLFVLEDGKPFSLCSGKACEENLKIYFKLKSTD